MSLIGLNIQFKINANEHIWDIWDMMAVLSMKGHLNSSDKAVCLI